VVAGFLHPVDSVPVFSPTFLANIIVAGIALGLRAAILIPALRFGIRMARANAFIGSRFPQASPESSSDSRP
jgi:hypothetical protein